MIRETDCRNYHNEKILERKWSVTTAIIAMIGVLFTAGTVDAITISQNTAPSASKIDPVTDKVNLVIGDTLNFLLRGTDPDGNLRGTEWYINGKHQTSHFILSGTIGTDSWRHIFNASGMYTVEALVFDAQNAYSSQPATWTVQVDAASIISLSPSTGIKNPGNSLSSRVTVKNTGVNTRSYWVGFGYQKPDGTFYNLGPQQTNILFSGSQQTLIFNWNLPQDAPYGNYNAVTRIWNGYDPVKDLMESPQYDSKSSQKAFSIPSDPFKFQPRAIYVWGDAYKILESPIETGNLIQFARYHGINTFFFYTDTSGLTGNPALYREFILKAHSNNLYVHALNGRSAWTTDHQAAVNYIMTVLNYNKNSQPTEKFDGIYLDIEPYTLSSWEKDPDGNSFSLARSSVNKNLAIQYLQLLSSINNTISASGETLTFGEDIPFWLDSNGFELTYNGKTKLLSSHIQDQTDFITVMDYTDNYNNAITWAAYEINYGIAAGKYVVISFETQKLDNPESTFFEEGNVALENAFKQVSYSLSSKSSFKGFAIHDYNSYKALR